MKITSKFCEKCSKKTKTRAYHSIIGFENECEMGIYFNRVKVKTDFDDEKIRSFNFEIGIEVYEGKKWEIEENFTTEASKKDVCNLISLIRNWKENL